MQQLLGLTALDDAAGAETQAQDDERVLQDRVSATVTTFGAVKPRGLVLVERVPSYYPLPLGLTAPDDLTDVETPHQHEK